MTNDLSVPRALAGRDDFRRAVTEVLQALPGSPVREAWLVDTDLADWPLGDPAVLEALVRWLRQPQRRLYLLAADFAPLARAQPRFAAWRRDWGHAVHCASPGDGEPRDLPCLLVAAPQCLELFDRERWRGVLDADRSKTTQRLEWVAAISQRSVPAWPVDTLGI